MALTLTIKNQYGQPAAMPDGSYFVPFTCLFDSSYPTGGEPLAPADLLLPSGNKFTWLTFSPAAGYYFEYDYTNQKIKAYTPVKKLASASIDPASLASVTARDEALTVTGVAATDEVIGGRGPDALEAKYIPKGYRVTGADAVAARVDNPSAAAIDPAAGVFTTYLVGANGVGKEVANTTDLSAVTARAFAIAAVVA